MTLPHSLFFFKSCFVYVSTEFGECEFDFQEFDFQVFDFQEFDFQASALNI